MKVKTFWLALCVAAVLMVGDVAVFAWNLLPSEALARPTPSERFDLLAVLTGGQGRLKEAFQIFKEDRAEYLFISGVDSKVKLEDILQVQELQDLDSTLRGRVFLGSDSTSTVENAEEIADFIEASRIRTVLLVTSSYHYRRAFELLKREVSDRKLSVKLLAFSVESPNFPRDSWWSTWTGWNILLSEYFKSAGLRLTGGWTYERGKN